MSTGSVRLRRTCLRLAAALLAWTAIVMATGGVTIWIGSVRLLSARGTRNPLVLASIAVALWWRLTPRGAVAASFTADAIQTGHLLRDSAGTIVAAIRRALAPVTRAIDRWSPWIPPMIGATATAAIVLTGCLQGSFVAGGADAYGYVSQAHLWAAGKLEVEAPLIRDLAGLLEPVAMAPLGYRPNASGNALVPSYAAGYPMTMALAERLAGRPAVFYVVPLLAGLAVGATYLLGRAVAGPAAGACAAMLLATSPPFLVLTTWPPMSDIPATAWWTLALVLVGGNSRAAALGAGVAAGAAVLTRPNLVPLAIIPAVVLAWPIVSRRAQGAGIFARVALYSAGVVAAALATAALNSYWYGSAMESGYGSPAALYSRQHFWTNVRLYSRWLAETHTPLIALAAAGPFLLRRSAWRNTASSGATSSNAALANAAAVFAAAVAVSYLFYAPFDTWWYLRFLLPAFPILLVFFSVTLLALTARLPTGIRRLTVAAVIAGLAWHGFATARDGSAFTSETERKYALIGRYIAKRLPERAVVLAMVHSGSAGYYSGRPTIRYDWIPPTRFDQVVARLGDLGYQPYLVLEPQEVEAFRKAFATATPLGPLDWPPVARLPLGEVNIFKLVRPPAGGPPAAGPEIVPDPL